MGETDKEIYIAGFIEAISGDISATATVITGNGLGSFVESLAVITTKFECKRIFEKKLKISAVSFVSSKGSLKVKGEEVC